jgi:TonB family protein
MPGGRRILAIRLPQVKRSRPRSISGTLGNMKASVSLLVVTLCLLLPATGLAASADERSTTYQDFRGRFDSGKYSDALPLAARVVELTKSQFGNEAPELANPLVNLGTTYYRMQEHGKALDTYREALNILDLQGNAVDARLVPVLHGMGVALRGLQRDPEAITPLKRALDILRNKDGLHSTTQLPVLKQLIACYLAAGLFPDAGREQQYSYSIAETAYGKDDLRMLTPLNEFALWNEAVGRYSAARLLHFRAVQIADNKQGNSNLAAIDGLRGVARSYRLAFLNGEAEQQSPPNDPSIPGSLSENALARMLTAPSSEGERALRIALQRLAAAPTPQPRLHGQVLMDLGDWQMMAGADARAILSYQDAWRLLMAIAATQPLESPMAVVYRAPTMAVSRRVEDADKFDQQTVELRLNVDENGKVREATVANPAPEREAAERALIGAVKRAKWRPAFRDGAPVASTNVEFREAVFIRKPKDNP